ncbi:hypothetical protein CYMTET_55678 [Cymbomonas tetramitiformis]|uniref:Protein kinase domain-containing protein n=1 Tax=Cymbomonas tetramitiformis TaxID=36881 RepID=A0AAE0ENC2_9CHLO|nr:hypothetical protein CYMTET_55678 [Cymbomonas tetramitiformis]
MEYVGGDTRLVTWSRQNSLEDLCSKLGLSETAEIRYRLPGEEEEVLVSLINNEDLENMLTEYDEYSTEGKPNRLRIYCCTQPGLEEEVSSGGGSSQDTSGSTGFSHSVGKENMHSELQAINEQDIEILKPLGSGAFGDVYKALWNGAEVAIKRLRKNVFEGEGTDHDSEFWKEAEVLYSLHHPNVLPTFGVIRATESFPAPAIVTEYIVNGSLKHVLGKYSNHLNKKHRISLAMQAARGMEYLHSVGLVHFDLKSDNLLVNMRDKDRPLCKVSDFGLSKQKRNRSQSRVSGVTGLIGTLPWTAPEVVKACERITDKVDIYSFGIVMWELWTNEVPHADLEEISLLGKILTENAYRPKVPDCDNHQAPADGWSELMQHCWAENPENRPTFSEVSQKLSEMLSNLSKQK